MTPTQAAQRVVEVASRPNGTEQDLQPLAQAFFDSLGGTPQEAAEAGVRELSRGIVAAADGGRAALVALMCGALVESGADPSLIDGPLFERLRSAAPRARRFHEAAAAGIPDDAEDRDERLEAARRRLALAMPAEAEAWVLLEKLFPPVIAVLSVSPEARRREQALRPDLDPLAGDNRGAHWIAQMLRVLHEEPYLAIEPATGLGVAGRMSGVADNFQLNVLLMDALPRRGLLAFARRRVSAEAAAVARGEGPQQTEEILTGHWNLYAWTAVGADLSLPDPTDYATHVHWIWNEGTPADIPVFDGRRVIILGPPSYARTWRCQRLFDHLKAGLTVEQELGKADVRQWLQRFASADRSAAGG